MGEPTASKAVKNSATRFYVYRGGGFNATDLRDFHVATRNRRITESRDRFLGIRLAADLPPRR